MQRQRGELVPLAEALSELPGPVKAIREASHQTLHHYTRFDQVNQLVSASEADPDLGFMARMLVLCSLPRTNPGNRKFGFAFSGGASAPLLGVFFSASYPQDRRSYYLFFNYLYR